MRLDIIAVLSLSILAVHCFVKADFVYENELIITSEVFDLKYALDSDIDSNSRNATKYYCVFRSLWTPEDHPNDYPTSARYGPQILLSHTNQYTPLLKNREPSFGLQILAENSVTSVFHQQIQEAGDLVLDSKESPGFFINQKFQNQNVRYLPPINVRSTHSYISGIASIDPSPDWFTGFYMMDTIDEYSRRYWSEFTLHTYPWDAGSDDGKTYGDVAQKRERLDKVQRFTASTAPNGVFVSPLGDEILPVAEWQCQLHTCPIEDPDCVRENWPPRNGCDVLRFPDCDTECDPKEDTPCERCAREFANEPEVWYGDCCKAGRVPRGQRICTNDNTSDSTTGLSHSALVCIVLGVLIVVVTVVMMCCASKLLK